MEPPPLSDGNWRARRRGSGERPVDPFKALGLNALQWSRRLSATETSNRPGCSAGASTCFNGAVASQRRKPVEGGTAALLDAHALQWSRRLSATETGWREVVTS